MKQPELDLTEILFPREELTLEMKTRSALYSKASSEADKELRDEKSPVKRLAKIKEIYLRYLSKAGLQFNEEEGL